MSSAVQNTLSLWHRGGLGKRDFRQGDQVGGYPSSSGRRGQRPGLRSGHSRGKKLRKDAKKKGGAWVFGLRFLKTLTECPTHNRSFLTDFI